MGDGIELLARNQRDFRPSKGSRKPQQVERPDDLLSTKNVFPTLLAQGRMSTNGLQSKLYPMSIQNDLQWDMGICGPCSPLPCWDVFKIQEQ